MLDKQLAIKNTKRFIQKTSKQTLKDAKRENTSSSMDWMKSYSCPVRASRAAKPAIAEEKKLAPQKSNKEKLRERENLSEELCMRGNTGGGYIGSSRSKCV